MVQQRLLEGRSLIPIQPLGALHNHGVPGAVNARDDRGGSQVRRVHGGGALGRKRQARKKQSY